MDTSINKFISDIEIIKKASQTKKLVIFVGAGVSVNSGIPDWTTLLNELRNDIGIENKDISDPLQVAQVYFNEKKHKVYIEKIRKVLKHKKQTHNEIHELIFDLNPEYVVTTNYDDLLDQVIAKKALPFSIIKKDSDFPYAINSNLLVKIHGDLDNDDFVLKEDDYIAYEQTHPLFEAFIKYIFSSKVVLFIGYGYSDINLKIILEKVRNILGKNYQNSFLLSTSALSSYKINYLNNQGVDVISYKTNSTYVDSYLSGENFKSLTINESKELNGHGLSLFKLLMFIKTHDRFNEELKKENPINQVFHSLNRFLQLSSLPYYFISNLYPLNNTNKKIYFNQHDPFILNIKNNILFDFFKDNTEIKENDTVLTEKYLSIYKEPEQSILTERFKKIVDVFNSSNIAWLMRSDDHDNVKIYKSREKNNCECYACLFRNLKLSKLVNNLSVDTVNDNTNLNNDFLVAFSHYKLGNIYESYNMFEEIARKSWHSELYVLYYISKINLKRLGNIIHSSEYGNIAQEHLKIIEDKSEYINMEDVYRQINEVSKEEEELIKILRDDELFHRSVASIDEAIDKIHENYRITKYNKTFKKNRTYVDAINFHTGNLYNFYVGNKVVYDIYSSFKKPISKSFEALLIDQATNIDYKDRINLLGSFNLKLAVHYANANDLNEFLKQENIENIFIDDDAKEYLLDSFDNYLSSFYSDNNMFNDTETNHKLKYYTEKTSFNRIYPNYFDKLFLLSSRIHLEDQEINKILTKTKKFLKVSRFLFWYNIQYFSIFLSYKKEYISLECIIDLIEIIFENNKNCILDVLESFGGMLSNKPTEERINKQKLLAKLDDFIKETNNLNSYRYLWEISDDEFRKNIELKIINSLNVNFEPYIYREFAIRQIIKYDSFFTKYLEYVNDNKKNEVITFFSNEPQHGIYNIVFAEFYIFIIYLNIQIDDKILNGITDREPYMNFFLDPENFDYSQFNADWLTLFINISQVHKYLAKFSVVRENFVKHLEADKSNQNLKDLFIHEYLN